MVIVLTVPEKDASDTSYKFCKESMVAFLNGYNGVKALIEYISIVFK